MAEIELIIKIPEEDWKFLKESDGCRWSRTIVESVINGTPKPKTGWWIDTESLDGALWYACSECGETEFHATNYCPNCGAKMESDDKKNE